MGQIADVLGHRISNGYTLHYMTVTESPPSAAPARPAARPPRADRSNGQWKVDGQGPLNANEAWKQEDGGLNVRERIEQIYSKEGFDSIPAQDLTGRFRWWGLYTQRKPGIDGGRTAQLERRRARATSTS